MTESSAIGFIGLKYLSIIRKLIFEYCEVDLDISINEV